MHRNHKRRLLAAAFLILCLLLSSCSKLGISMPVIRIPGRAPVENPAAPAAATPMETPVLEVKDEALKALDVKASSTTSALVAQNEMVAAPVAAVEPVVESASETPVQEEAVVQGEEQYFSQIYRGGRFLIRGDFYSQHAELMFSSMSLSEVNAVIGKLIERYPFLVQELTYSIVDTTLTLSYGEKEEYEIREYWQGFVVMMDELNFTGFFDVEERSEVEVQVEDDKVFVFLTEDAQARAMDVLAGLLSENPEYSSVQYTLDDGLIVLTSQTPIDNVEEKLEDLKARLENDSPVEEVEETAEPAAAIDEVKTEALPVAVATINSMDSSVPEPVVPKTKAGIVVREHSASVYGSAGFNITDSGSPVGGGIGFKYDARLTDNLSLGFRLGLQLGLNKSIPLMASVRYDLDTDLYAFGNVGIVAFGKKVGTFVLEGGVGYEMELSDMIMGFAEVGVRVRNSDPYFGVFANIGARYTF